MENTKFKLHDIVKDSNGFQGRVGGYYDEDDKIVEVCLRSGWTIRNEEELTMVKKYDV